MEHEPIRFRPHHVRHDEDLVANPEANADEVIGVLAQVPDSDIVLFPELGVTGYTCADLFGQARCWRRGSGRPAGSPRPREGVRNWSSSGCRSRSATACTTAAWRSRRGRSSGSSPSSSSRITRSSTRAAGSARPTGGSPGRSTSAAGASRSGSTCCSRPRRGRGRRGRDLRGPLDADPAQLGRRRSPGRTSCSTCRRATRRSARGRYRTDLVVGQSGRCIAAYAYASSGPSESTTDLVFGGHCLIAENGRLLKRVEPGRRRRPDRPRDRTSSRRTSTSRSSRPTAARRPASTTA